MKQNENQRSATMPEPIRIPPEAVREKVASGAALLVCAYDDPDKFKNNHLEGALSLDEFTSRLPSLTKDREIIFYCA
jgi:rhodanese-related sulfurtransferase